jgi:hypothetical protein
MKTILIFIAVAFSFLTQISFAANVAPLGLELGVATIDKVKKEIGSRTKLVDNGINAYSEGQMLAGNGEGLELDGLKEITFIFDKSNVLAGVLMTFPKGGMGNENFKEKLAMLSAKYKIVEKSVPFVGDSYTKLKLGDSIVELKAPHMSFDMSLNYLTNRLLKNFYTVSAKESAEKQKKQANNL